MICNNIGGTGRCGCRASFGLVGEECTELTLQSAWSLAATSVGALAYLGGLFYVAHVALMERRQRSSRGKSLSSRSQSLLWSLLSLALMLYDLLFRFFSILGYSDKLLYDLATNVSESLGASAGIAAYCSIALGWIQMVQATRKLGSYGRRVRRTRHALLAFITLYAACTIALTVVIIWIDLKLYFLFIGAPPAVPTRAKSHSLHRDVDGKGLSDGRRPYLVPSRCSWRAASHPSHLR